MVGGKSCGWHAATAAARPHLVVVAPLVPDYVACLVNAFIEYLPCQECVATYDRPHTFPLPRAAPISPAPLHGEPFHERTARYHAGTLAPFQLAGLQVNHQAECATLSGSQRIAVDAAHHTRAAHAAHYVSEVLAVLHLDGEQQRRGSEVALDVLHVVDV